MKQIVKNHLTFGAVVFALVIVYWNPVRNLVLYSLAHESSSHILLVPFAGMWLVYRKRSQIFAGAKFSVIPGILVVGSGYLFRLLAPPSLVRLGGNSDVFATGLALGMSICGAFLLCYGMSSVRKAIFPLAFLTLMVPLPEAVLDRTIYFLQAGSSATAAILFKVVGVPVLRQGFILSVPGVTIEVAKECSGIRSSLALFITCLIAAQIFLCTVWRRFVFTLLSIPLAILKNGLRITTLTLLSTHVDPGFLTGRLHREGGFVFFGLTLTLLVPVLLLMRRQEANQKSSLVQKNGEGGAVAVGRA
jgi:exosortase